MPALPRPAPLLAALVCAACQTAASGGNAGPPSVLIHYQHVRTCPDFLGGPGQFFAYEIQRIENRGTETFDFVPAQLRFSGLAGADVPPVLLVPEFSDRERVEPASRDEITEIYLLEHGALGPPPRGAVPLSYARDDVMMVQVPGDPVFDDESGCLAFAT